MKKWFWPVLGIVIVAVIVSNLMVVYVASTNNRGYTTIGVPGSPGRDGQSIVGPQGPRGPQGMPGKNGKDGANGAPGANGQNGMDGRNGVDGKDGENGPPGPVGPAGIDGKTPELNCVEESETAVIKWRYHGEETWRTLATIPNGKCSAQIVPQAGD